MHRLAALGLVLATTTLHAAGSERFVRQLELPSGQLLRVAEGEQEPRSIDQHCNQTHHQAFHSGLRFSIRTCGPPAYRKS